MVIALSPHSPLGQKLMGLKANDAVEMNGTRYKIENVA
jgi:transcription elongation GreA/GreB family factor